MQWSERNLISLFSIFFLFLSFITTLNGSLSTNEEDESDDEEVNEWKRRRYSLQINSTSKGYQRTRAKISIQPQLDSEDEVEQQPQPPGNNELLSRQNTV